MADKLENQEVEVWRKVNGFEEKYEVSNLGNLISNNWNRTGERRKVKTYFNKKNGYIYVVLQSNGKLRRTTVHRVVAEAFIPNPDNLEQVDHIDNDKTNNAVKNLRWVSRKFNNSRPHAIAMRKKNYRHEIHSHQFVKASNDREVRYFKNACQTSRELGCSNTAVLKALSGQTRRARGWCLEYVDKYLPECDQLREQLLLEKQTKLSESKRNRMDASRMIKERKGRINKVAMSSNERLKKINEFKRLARVIVQLDLDGTPVREWKNIYSAEHALQLRNIRLALLGIKESIGGFLWKWKLDI